MPTIAASPSPCSVDDANAFSALSEDEQQQEVTDCHTELRDLLRQRTIYGGPSQLNILVLDVKMDSGNLVAVSAVVETLSSTFGKDANIFHADIFRKEDTPYEVPFDRAMAKEDGRRVALER